MAGKHYTLDSAPSIMSKFLAVLDEEADRINAIPSADRKPADIKLAISCITALTAIHKDVRAEEKDIALTFKTLDDKKVKSILG